METVQQTLAVFFVLGLLGGAMFWFRRKGFSAISFGPLQRATSRRMQAVERLVLTPQHSLHLVKVAGKVLLIGVSPAGCSVLESDCKEVVA